MEPTTGGSEKLSELLKWFNASNVDSTTSTSETT